MTVQKMARGTNDNDAYKLVDEAKTSIGVLSYYVVTTFESEK